MRIKKTDNKQIYDGCQEILKSTMIKTIKIIVHQKGGNYQKSVTASLSHI